MTADMTRQEVRFIRWDAPGRKQEDLLDLVKDGECGRMDKTHYVLTGLGKTAIAFWKNGGNRTEYVDTMPDGTDGDLKSMTIPKIAGTNACYNREYLVKILSNMTGDLVRIRIDDDSTIMVMMGLIGAKEAAAIIAPRFDTEAEE